MARLVSLARLLCVLGRKDFCFHRRIFPEPLDLDQYTVVD